MVSTRQTSNFGGGGESSGTGPEPGTSKSARHSVAHSSTSEPSTSGQLVTTLGTSRSPSLLDCPVEIIEKIFSFLPYKTVAHIRPVCRKVDSVCCHLLNTTFQRLQNQMQVRFQTIKAKMPRRESARRNHPLACESDIIETLHMRLTLLHMTFGKHIERKHCCFFAGEILDEVYRILHYIRVTPVMARPYKVTDELFDLSTMAMEYFKDYIEPTLPEINYFNPNFLDFASAYNNPASAYLCLESGSTSGTSRGGSEDGREDPASLAAAAAAACGLQDDSLDPPPQSNMVLRKRIRKIKQGMKKYNSQLSLMRRDLRNCKSKIADQQKQILDYAARLDENDKKNEETSRKFSTLLQELNKCKTELQYWRSKSPANPPLCAACGVAVAPAPPEELQALANQGVLPQGLDLASVDFVPIVGDEHAGAPEPAVASPALQPAEADSSAPTETSPTAPLAVPVACKACPPPSAKRKSPVSQDDVAGEGAVLAHEDTEGVSAPKKVRRGSKGRGKRPKLL